MDKICSSKDEFEMMFKLIDNILNEHKEDSNQGNSSEESDEVFDESAKSRLSTGPRS